MGKWTIILDGLEINTDIGNREYLENNYIENKESITQSIDSLDIKIGNESEITANNIINPSDNI